MYSLHEIEYTGQDHWPYIEGLEEKNFHHRFYQTALAFRYYSSYFSDLTYKLLMIKSKGEVRALVPMSFSKDRCGFFEFPISIVYAREDLSADENFEISSLLVPYFKKVLQERALQLAQLPAFNSLALSNPCTISNTFGLMIDLELSTESILRDVRKRYRPFLNWGKRELQTTVYDAQTVTPEIFSALHQFHVKTAGRETRPRSTWDCQYEMIKSGQGFLVMSQYQGLLVSATLLVTGSEEVYYGVGVNDRELMEQGLAIGHYNMFAGILHAKELGYKYFNLGPVYSEHMNDKEKAIARFKSGFSSSVKIDTSLHLSPAGALGEVTNDQ